MSTHLLLVSSSRCHPTGYLEHCEDQVVELFRDAGQLVFIPYARPGGATHEAYSLIACNRFAEMGLSLRGIEDFSSPTEAVANAGGVFIGGGNTFVLLRDLYQDNLVSLLRDRIVAGMPYMGTSAGSNVAGLSIGTSNDMPIVHPPTFDALGVVPFNLNPHYPRTPPDPTHMGETREDRIGEFHVFNTQPVVGLREDGMLRVRGSRMELIGEREAIVFEPGSDPRALPTFSDIDTLRDGDQSA